MKQRQWVHVFPEGKVNTDMSRLMRFKWGLGRLILEADPTPMVVPIYHLGMP
jgi:monolysocardiolipin acyltransferase